LSFYDKIRLYEQELTKRLGYPYSWGRKQNDNWDSITNFIYRTPSFDELVEKLDNINADEALFNYALNRWYNFHSAAAIEIIFKQHPLVVPEVDVKHKSIDFYISGIAFDHKSSVFPRGFGKSLDYAQRNKAELAYWFYKEQSQERRFHNENRLFIVMHDSKGYHWKLKSKIGDLNILINQYLNTFDAGKLIELEFNQKKVLCDVLIFEQ
jgi:hypothetical protein